MWRECKSPSSLQLWWRCLKIKTSNLGEIAGFPDQSNMSKTWWIQSKSFMNQSNRLICALFNALLWCFSFVVRSSGSTSTLVAAPVPLNQPRWDALVSHSCSVRSHREFDTTSMRLEVWKSIHLTHQLQLFLCLHGGWRRGRRRREVKNTGLLRFCNN